MSNSAPVSDEDGITKVVAAWKGYSASSSGSACKSRWERVSRIKVIDPAHLTEARITGHTMACIVRTGLFSATHAGLSAAHYLEMPCCHSAPPSYTRARSRLPRPALRYVTRAHACLAGHCALWKRVFTPPALDLGADSWGSNIRVSNKDKCIL